MPGADTAGHTRRIVALRPNVPGIPSAGFIKLNHLCSQANRRLKQGTCRAILKDGEPLPKCSKARILMAIQIT